MDEKEAKARAEAPKAVIVGSVAAYAAYQIGWPAPGSDLVVQGGFWIAALIAAKGAVFAGIMASRGYLAGYHLARSRAGEGIKGDAEFLSARKARKEGMGDPDRGPFIGLIGDQPVFASSESASLVLGPNGSGKTTNEAIGRIAYTRNSIVVFDIKGELYALTSQLRRDWHKNNVARINPLVDCSDCLNPLDLISEALSANNPDALVLAHDFAAQLHPMPKGGGGANTFFIEGAQQLLEDLFLMTCCVYGKRQANLAFVYEHLVNMDLLRRTVVLAAESEALKGEIALRAENVSRGLSNDEEAA